MRISGKSRSEPLEARDGSREFYVYWNRGEGADRDMSFVLQSHRPGSRSEEDVHDLEQWFFVHRGRVRFTIDGEERIARPGDLVFVPRNARHWHQPQGREAAELLVINHWPEDSEDQMGWDYADDEPSVQPSSSHGLAGDEVDAAAGATRQPIARGQGCCGEGWHQCPILVE
jgi:quercetin dioxygenase-like cupin family protein